MEGYKTIETPVEIDESELVVEYLDLQSKIKELTARKDEITEILKEKIGEHSYGMTENAVITYKYTKPSVKFDSKKFKKDNGALYEKYCFESAPIRRFVVKGVEDEI